MSAAASDYPYLGVAQDLQRVLADAEGGGPLQDENDDFTTYVLDGLQWLRDRKIVYFVLSKGHCDFFPHAGIEQCSIEDASDGKKSEAFSRLGALGTLGIEERIHPSEQTLLTDRGVDAIRVKCGSVEAIKPFLGTENIGGAHATSLGKRARSATTSRPLRRSTTIWWAASCARSGT